MTNDDIIFLLRMAKPQPATCWRSKPRTSTKRKRFGFRKKST